MLVIEDGFLTSFLREDLPEEVMIVRLPKSSGVVTRTADQWTRQRDARVCAYLHGENPFRRLHPHQLVLKASEVSLIWFLSAATVAIDSVVVRRSLS